MARRKLDQYFTPPFFTQVLLDLGVVGAGDALFEPCSGAGDIVSVLNQDGSRTVVTNDIDASMPSDYNADARKPECFDFIRNHETPESWAIVTNPPFRSAFPIIQNAVASGARVVAMLVRLTFLEPTNERAPWLKENPPAWIVVLPRWSFLNNGKTDSATYAWVIWDREASGVSKINFFSREDFSEHYKRRRKPSARKAAAEQSAAG
jgi:hypothetical protein